jgi:hypothetical protein
MCCVHVLVVEGKHLNMLEVEFLFLIDFNLFVTEVEYAKIYYELVVNNPLFGHLFKLKILTISFLSYMCVLSLNIYVCVLIIQKHRFS